MATNGARAYRTTYAETMKSVPVTRARASLYRLIDQVAESAEPITITGRRADAVLVSADHWRAIQETLHLLSVPGMRESIRKGLDTPIEECADEPGW